MPLVSQSITSEYLISREVSQVADLATLLLARLLYGTDLKVPTAVNELVGRLETGRIEQLSGTKANKFAAWLYDYLLVNKTTKGTSFYPIHPALTLPSNGEGTRVDSFLNALAGCFTTEERSILCQRLWSSDRLPAFESALYDLMNWQVPVDLASAISGSLTSPEDDGSTISPQGILMRTKEDLLSLAEATIGILTFIQHAGRLLAFSISRYLLAKSGVGFELPIYAAPAADTHPGVKTLAHEILAVHRAQFTKALRTRFCSLVDNALDVQDINGDTIDEQTAQELSRRLFSSRANVIPTGKYVIRLQEYGSFADIAYNYYWSSAGAASRFLRQLHTAQLNLAKKAGLVLSRSQHSQWHFYWLSPALVETLLLVRSRQIPQERILIVNLLKEWQERYGIAVLIEQSWEDSYRRHFRSLGSPEALNEANLRRFADILAERGRLYKNSDDFPWVVLGGQY